MGDLDRWHFKTFDSKTNCGVRLRSGLWNTWKPGITSSISGLSGYVAAAIGSSSSGSYSNARAIRAALLANWVICGMTLLGRRLATTWIHRCNLLQNRSKPAPTNASAISFGCPEPSQIGLAESSCKLAKNFEGTQADFNKISFPLIIVWNSQILFFLSLRSRRFEVWWYRK